MAQIQLTIEVTHFLENQGQESSAWSNPGHHRSYSLPEEPRIGIVNRVQIQLTTEATHKLESQGQALSAGSKSSSRKPLTNWRAKDKCHEQGQNATHHKSHSQTREWRTDIMSRIQLQLTAESTHFLESQGQALSAGSKCSSPQKPLTDWRAKDRHCQQGPNPAHHENHSLPGEPKIGIVSKVQI